MARRARAFSASPAPGQLPSGLSAIPAIFATIAQDKLDKAVEEMDIFAIGDSWGGYESLIKQAHLTDKMRRFTPEHTPGHLIRVYAGIEHGPDLWTDIAAMLDKLA